MVKVRQGAVISRQGGLKPMFSGMLGHHDGGQMRRSVIVALGVGLLAACASEKVTEPVSPAITSDPNASLASCVPEKQVRLNKHDEYITAVGKPVQYLTYIPPQSGELVTETWLLAISRTTADYFTFTRQTAKCQVDSVFAYTFPAATVLHIGLTQGRLVPR